MSRAELVRSLAALAEPPTDALRVVVTALELPCLPRADEHTDLFALQLHPYASVHLGPEGQLGGVARDRVAGFLRALGAVPPPEPDHLVVLLGAYAELVERDDDPAGPARHARRALFHEHLLPWLPRFAWRAGELGAPPYRTWAALLAAAVDAEVAVVGHPPHLPAHLREAPALPDPREGDASAFLAGLLAPVRSGLILARADLARIARELDLGLRVGERAFMLRALLGQDPAGTLRALAGEAERQRDAVPGTDHTAAFWRARLSRTVGLLSALAAAERAVAATG